MANLISVKLMPDGRRAPKLFLAAVLILVLLIPFSVDPQRNQLPQCRFYAMTGHSCPSCGLTRSFFALGHLDVQQAFGFHPLGLISCLALLALSFKFLIEVLLGRELAFAARRASLRTFGCVIIGLWLCLWLGFWGLRLNAEMKAQRGPPADRCQACPFHEKAHGKETEPKDKTFPIRAFERFDQSVHGRDEKSWVGQYGA